LNATQSTSVGAFFGQSMARATPDGRQTFTWQKGVLSDVLEYADTHRDVLTFLLLDEINVFPADVLQKLVPLFQAIVRGAPHFTPGRDSETYDISRLRLFATMNPAAIGGGRAALPPSLLALFVRVELAEYSAKDMHHIFARMIRQSSLLSKQSPP